LVALRFSRATRAPAFVTTEFMVIGAASIRVERTAVFAGGRYCPQPATQTRRHG
jgi:hypothetical protein